MRLRWLRALLVERSAQEISIKVTDAGVRPLQVVRERARILDDGERVAAEAAFAEHVEQQIVHGSVPRRGDLAARDEGTLEWASIDNC
mgnify:CR=1 FL=1